MKWESLVSHKQIKVGSLLRSSERETYSVVYKILMPHISLLTCNGTITIIASQIDDILTSSPKVMTILVEATDEE